MQLTLLAGICFFGLSSLVNVRGSGDPTLIQLQEILATKRFVDLAHAFAPGIPH